MYQTMQNCLPVKVQHTNNKKVEVLMYVLVRKGRKAQFVRFLRMGVNSLDGLRPHRTGIPVYMNGRLI